MRTFVPNEKLYREVAELRRRLDRLTENLAGVDSQEIPARTGSQLRLVLRIVAKHTGLTGTQILKKRRFRVLDDARVMVFSIAKEATGVNPYTVARFFKRDNGCVYSAAKKCRNRCETEPKFKAVYDQCLAEVKKGINV